MCDWISYYNLMSVVLQYI